MKRRILQLFLTTFLTVVALTFSVSSAFALLKVNVMPSGVSSPANIWDSKPYAWPGNSTELWGNVAYDGVSTLTYTWKFGDATADASGTVTDRNNIAVNHTYAAQSSYVATLTVTDGTQSDTDTVFLDVVPHNFQVEKRLAIQRGLKYLYMKRLDWNINGCNTFYWNDTRWTGDTGLAVLAFEDHGHRASNDRNKDIYAETVAKGLQAIEAMLRQTGTSNSPPYSVDINGNGRMSYEGNSGGNMYEQGILMMALANSAAPEATVTCGTSGAVANGTTYRSLLEDMVEYTGYAQQESNCSGMGGWRYTANYCSSDNSVSQWPALGLAAAAGAPFSIINTNNDPVFAYNTRYPAWIKSRMQNWLSYSQNGNGGFGYTHPGEWVNIAKTGSGISAITFAGGGGSLTNALNYVANNWNTTTYDYGNKGDHYAMYAVKKGLQYAKVATIGGHDWQNEYDQWYVANKRDNGTNGYYWDGSVRISGGRTATSFALLVMAPGLVELPPIADAGLDQEVAFNTNVSFDGSGSHHSDPSKSIISYEWDFDYDGTTLTVDASGVAPTKIGGYSLPAGFSEKNFTVALRVADNAGLTDIDTAIVKVSNGNVAPVANPGGPYLCGVGEVITLNGSASYDPNSCTSGPGCLGDAIVAYAWDFDGDGVYNDASGATPSFTCSALGTQTIKLKVTDSYGASATQSAQATTVAVSNLQPVCYVNTINSYNRVTGKWTVGWKMKLSNSGNAAASAVSAVLTNSSVPAGVAVLDNSLSWNGSLGAGTTTLSSDDFRYTYPRNGSVDLTKITFDIEFTDVLSTRRVVRSVPQGAGGTCAP